MLSSGSESVVVAILTFQRPHSLERTLSGVARVVSRCDFPVDVMVIDNDPARSAWPIVSDCAYMQVKYVHEPKAGIASARNRALDEADGATLLAFIDDDEVPEASWLEGLVGTWRRFMPDLVAGPTLKTFSFEPTGWVMQSGAFDVTRWETGTVLKSAASGNLLMDLEAVKQRGVRFDVEFGATGGEDTMFSRQLVVNGGTIIWCDEAVVSEPVTAERATRRWVLRRDFRAGTTWGRVRVALVRRGAARTITRLLLVARGGFLVSRAAVGWLLDAVIGRGIGRPKRERAVASGLGVLWGAFGFRFEEYGRHAVGAK